jgi:ubiquinone/menaquinone biosynthesis C-methylase UbiE
MASFDFVCPRCRAPLAQTGPDELLCPAEMLHFRRQDGLWRFLLPERAAYFENFIRDYETIRRAEGRGSREAAYYRALPEQDLSGNLSADWRIRAASFKALIQKVIAPAKEPLRILDLGAGNGWLSNRLAARGHTVAAVDLLTNDFDGLGCRSFYTTDFTALQAEFDRLPLAAGNADLIIFNASLHYAVDFRATLAEALRVLARGGKLVVLDSPIYRQAGSGEKMVRERESQFTQRYGFPSNALPSQNYLTYALLAELSAEFELDCQRVTPFYGLRWLLRPLRAGLSGAREPAKFHLLILRRSL